MRKILLLVAAVLLLGGGLWWIRAATTPTVAAPTVTPNLITVNTPTQVVATVNIPDVNVTAVNLLRINANGSSTIVATMLDNGQNGDQTAGDKIFTARLTLTEAQAGEVKLQVSAAFRGVLRRSLSQVAILQIWPLFTSSVIGVSVKYPYSLVPQESAASPSEGVGFYTAKDYSDGLPPLFNITTSYLPSGLTLHTWVVNSGGADIRETVLGDKVFLVWSESTGDYMSTLSFSTLVGNGRILTFSTASAEFAASPQFLSVVSSFVAQ